MARLSNKRMEKSTIARIVLVSVILLTDLFLLPWILKLPFFFFGLGNNLATAPNRWMDYGPWQSIKDVVAIAKFRKVYFVMQIPVTALIIGVSWNVDKWKKKNRISDGVGGPEPSGNGEHGNKSLAK